MFFLRDYALPVTLPFDVRTNNALRAAMVTWFQQLPVIMVRLFPRDPLSRFIDISGWRAESGGVEVDDFLRVLGRHWKEPVDEQRELQDAFAMFDRNNDGFVNADEIKFVMTRLGHALSDADVDDILRDADTNGDGKLDYTGEARRGR